MSMVCVHLLFAASEADMKQLKLSDFKETLRKSASSKCGFKKIGFNINRFS
jgi:hypothetical protein